MSHQQQVHVARRRSIRANCRERCLIGQVVLVHFLDVGRIASEEIGVALVGGVDGFCLTHISLTFVPLQGTLVG